jgi:hypothetical protein
VAIHEFCFLAFAEDGVFSSGRFEGSDLYYSEFGDCGMDPITARNVYAFNPLSFTLEQFDGPAKQYGVLALRFTACHGIAASGTAQAPQFGPITGVTLTYGGTGYAKLGRRQPTLSVTGVDDAVVTLSQESGVCNVPYWSIEAISAPFETEGLYEGQVLEIVIESGDVVEVAAICTVQLERREPALTAASLLGPVGPLNIVLADNGDGTWSIQSVTASGIPSNFSNSLRLLFAGGIEESPANVRIYQGRMQPTIDFLFYSSEGYDSGGSGAALSATMVAAGVDPQAGLPYWSVSDISITSGGSGYSVGDSIVGAPTGGSQTPSFFPGNTSFVAEVTSVTETGAIESVQVLLNGAYYKPDASSVIAVVYSGGRYYSEGVASISVENGGRYYREDPALPPIVADVTVEVVQPAGAFGSGAAVTATVNDDTSSPQFGKIAALTLVSGGTNYTDWKYTGACDTNPFP